MDKKSDDDARRLAAIRRQARAELAQEEFRAKVEAEKEKIRLRRKPWWKRIFSVRITWE